jgi:hypothetical protein
MNTWEKEASMGMTIHYSMHAPDLRDPAQARRIVEQLHAHAQTLGFSEVSEILDWTCEEAEEIHKMLFAYSLTTDDAPDLGDSEESLYQVAALDRIFFVIQQPGSETAGFGLSRYEPIARAHDDPEKTRPSNLPGFHWQAFCKTQYASLESEGGSFDNFLTIHAGICKMLDHARALGLTVTVHDESNFWDHRDAEKLRAEVHRWNTMVAAVAGNLKDAFGNRAGAVQGPIFKDPAFEKLEAQGQPFLENDPEIAARLLREIEDGKSE